MLNLGYGEALSHCCMARSFAAKLAGGSVVVAAACAGGNGTGLVGRGLLCELGGVSIFGFGDKGFAGSGAS